MGYVSLVSQMPDVHGWKKCFAPLPRTVYLVIRNPPSFAQDPGRGRVGGFPCFPGTPDGLVPNSLAITAVR